MVGFERYTKKTRGAIFLEEMEQVAGNVQESIESKLPPFRPRFSILNINDNVIFSGLVGTAVTKSAILKKIRPLMVRNSRLVFEVSKLAKPYTHYAKEITHGLRYGATWTPGTPLRLGQIGTFEDGIFLPLGHLNTMGIRFGLELDTSPTTYTYMSAAGVSLRFKAKGETSSLYKSLSEAKAGVAITFDRENAVVFSASGCLEHRISDILSLQALLADLLNGGGWKENWAVVTHLVVADSATVVLSQSANTVLELEATGSAGSGPAKVGDISGGVALSFSDSMNQLIVASPGLTPLFHSMRLKRSFWTGEPTPVLNKAVVPSKPRQRVVATNSFEVVDFEEVPSAEAH